MDHRVGWRLGSALVVPAGLVSSTDPTIHGRPAASLITPDNSDTPDADGPGLRDRARHIARHNAERHGDATASHNYGYLSELFGSERHKQLSPGIRMEQLGAILLHYQGLLDDGVTPNRGPPPPFVRWRRRRRRR